MTCNENDRLLRKTGRVFNNKAPHGYKVFEAANTDKIKLFRKTDAGVLKVKMTADFFCFDISFHMQRGLLNLIAAVLNDDFFFADGMQTFENKRLLSLGENRLRAIGEKAISNTLNK